MDQKLSLIQSPFSVQLVLTPNTPNLARRGRLACLDAAPQALELLTRAVRLGDVQTAEAVLRLALSLVPSTRIPGQSTPDR